MKSWRIAIAALIFSVLALIAILAPGKDGGETGLTPPDAGPDPVGTEVLVSSIPDSPIAVPDVSAPSMHSRFTAAVLERGEQEPLPQVMVGGHGDLAPLPMGSTREEVRAAWGEPTRVRGATSIPLSVDSETLMVAIGERWDYQTGDNTFRQVWFDPGGCLSELPMDPYDAELFEDIVRRRTQILHDRSGIPAEALNKPSLRFEFMKAMSRGQSLQPPRQ
jgi:hypothetical protein